MKVRFGMFMTAGVGRAGGQSIRRFNGGFVLSNITKPTIRIASNQNKQKNVNAWLFSQWNYLLPAVKDQWAYVASQIKKQNIFGVERSVSAREAFLMFNMKTYLFHESLLDPSVFNFETPLLIGYSFALDENNAQFTIDVASDSAMRYYEVRAKRIKNLSDSISTSKLKIFMRVGDVSNADSNFLSFYEAFPDVKAGDVYSIAICAVNNFGVSSPFFQQNVTVISS